VTVNAVEQQYGETRKRSMKIGNEIYDRWAARKALLAQVDVLTDEIDALMVVYEAAQRDHEDAKVRYEATLPPSPWTPRTRYARAKEIQRVKRLFDSILSGCQWDGRELRAPAGKIFAFTLQHTWRVNPGVRHKIACYYAASAILSYGLTNCRVRDCTTCRKNAPR
jgi:hypothetical protein